MAILPQSFVHVPAALTSRGVVNVVGIVVDVLPLFRTSGTSVCVTFTIKDCDLDNGHTWDGLKIKYFNDNENYLPHVMLRDVVLLRNIRVCYSTSSSSYPALTLADRPAQRPDNGRRVPV